MFDKLKSTEADFNFSTMTDFLDIMNKNILYLTHTMDKCLLVLKRLENDTNLQKQVSDYFGDDSSHFPEDSKQREEFVDKPGDVKWSSEQ